MEKDDLYDPSLVYDIRREKMLWSSIGGYHVVPGPPLLRFLNLLYVPFFVGLLCYWLAMSIYTLYCYKDDKEIFISGSLFSYTLLLSICLLLSRFFSDGQLKQAMEILGRGVFIYSTKDPEMEEIIRRRIKQIRRFVPLYSKIYLAVTSINIFTMPLLSYIQLDPYNTDLSNLSLNPYLPVPLDPGFRTDTLPRWIAAYVTEGLFMFILVTVWICHLQVSTATTLQLCAQLEILNYSLRTLEKRAFSIVFGDEKVVEKEQAYERQDVQKALYMCLRENIQHHQAIIRLYKLFVPYLEPAITTVVFGYSALMAMETLMYIESPLENASMIIFLGADTLGLLSMMVVCQMVEDSSTDIKDALYSTPWPNCSQEFKKMFLFCHLRSQIPIAIECWVIPIKPSLETFANIISWGYKIVNLINSRSK